MKHISPQTVHDVRRIILDYCTKWDWVSFKELQQYHGLKGPHLLEIQNLNIVIWSGLSLNFLDATCNLLETKRIVLCTGSKLSYVCDGGILPLPVARRIPSAGYRERHWLPMFLRLPKRVKNSEIKKREDFQVGAVLYEE